MVTVTEVSPALTGPETLAAGTWLQSPTVGPTAEIQPSWLLTVCVAEMIWPLISALVVTTTVLVAFPGAVPIGDPVPLA